MVNRRIDRRHEKLSRRPWARSSALRRRVHRWNPGRGVRGEMAGAPEEPYRMFGPDINSGVGAKGADWRRPRAHERAWQNGRRGLGQNIDRAKVISGKDQAHIDWVVREWSKTPTHVLQGITRMLAGADI